MTSISYGLARNDLQDPQNGEDDAMTNTYRSLKLKKFEAQLGGSDAVRKRSGEQVPDISRRRDDRGSGCGRGRVGRRPNGLPLQPLQKYLITQARRLRDIFQENPNSSVRLRAERLIARDCLGMHLKRNSSLFQQEITMRLN